jgi:transposase-like protein
MRYHANATTNIKQRQVIQTDQGRTCRELAVQFQVSLSTIHRWQQAKDVMDRSSVPDTIQYALGEYEQQLVCGIRQMEWSSVDDITLLLEDLIPASNRSNIYRTLRRAGLNRQPKDDKKQGGGEFKKYKPGYIHIDAFYLPKLRGTRSYVFVAIDRTTKMMHLEVYPDKTKESATSFLEECLHFFPFHIHTILTDNGREFTLQGFRNRYGTTQKVHQFTAYCWSQGVDHRTTKPAHPWTNGQVERVNGILEEKTIKRFTYESHEQIRQHLKQIETHWNYYKRHKTLGLHTVPQELKKWYDEDPSIFRVPFDRLPFAML